MESSVESGRVIRLTVVRYHGSRGRVVILWHAATTMDVSPVSVRPNNGTVCSYVLLYCVLQSVDLTLVYLHINMGVDHGEDGGNKSPPPRIWSRGTLVQIVPVRFLSYRYKKERSVAFKIRPGSAPNPTGGAHDAPPDPLVSWRGSPLTICHPIRHRPTFGTCRVFPSEFEPDLRLCTWRKV